MNPACDAPAAGVPGCLADGPAIYASVATAEAREWVRKTYHELTGGGELTPGQCAGCSPGDCKVCPGFPPFEKGSRRRSGNGTAARGAQDVAPPGER